MKVTRIYLRIKCDRELGVLRSQLWRALNALHRHLKLRFLLLGNVEEIRLV